MNLPPEDNLRKELCSQTVLYSEVPLYYALFSPYFRSRKPLMWPATSKDPAYVLLWQLYHSMAVVRAVAMTEAFDLWLNHSTTEFGS